MIKIVLADSYTYFNEPFFVSIFDNSAFKLCAVVGDGEMLLEVVEKLRPDIILLDIDLSSECGDLFSEQLVIRYSFCRVILLADQGSKLVWKAFQRSGARGVLMYPSDFCKIEEVFNCVMHGGYYLPEEIRNTCENEQKSEEIQPSTPPQHHFTAQEIQALQLLCEDKVIKEIAPILNCSIKTVERLRGSLYKKIGVQTVAGLLLFALRHNLLPNEQVRRLFYI